MNSERLVAGKTTFKLQVPFKLSSTGMVDKPKPLIVYLHGYGENIKRFENQFEQFETIEAYHLFIQGPFPTKIRVQDNAERGFAWYLYGDETTYHQHLEMSSEFIQEVIDQQLDHIQVSEICVIGYSMGAYLAGYWALTRWKHTNKVIMMSGRFKTELIADLNDKKECYEHMSVLGIHGENDSVVRPEPQKKAINEWCDAGLKGLFNKIEGDHKLSQNYITVAKNWLISNNYRTI